MKKYQDDEISYQGYTQEQTVEVYELVDAPYHSTLCLTCNCVCHNNCSLAETQEVGNQIFIRCAAMTDDNGNCARCPNNCSYSTHYHARRTMRICEQKLITVLHDIKVKYDIAAQNKSSFEQKLTSAQGTKKILEEALKQKIAAIQVQCRELRNICGSFNLAQELHVLIEQLRMEAQTLTSLEAQQQADVAIRELSRFYQSLEAEKKNTTAVKGDMIVVDTGRDTQKVAANFAARTQNQVQESSARVAAAEKILNIQVKKKKQPMAAKNANVSTINEPNNDKRQDGVPVHSSRQKSIDQTKSNSQKNRQLSTEPSHRSDQNSRGYSYDTPAIRPRSNSVYEKRNRTDLINSKQTAPKYESMSIKELVDEFYTAMTENRSKSAIERELRNRAQGITCPMITNSDRAMFARYTNKYSLMAPEDVSLTYMRLQNRVNKQLGGDNMDIERIAIIPPELLIELAALYTLFSSKSTAMNDSDDERYLDNDHKRSLPSHACAGLHSHRSIESSRQELDSRRLRANTYTSNKYTQPPSYDEAVSCRQESFSRPRSGSNLNVEASARDRQVSSKKFFHFEPN